MTKKNYVIEVRRNGEFYIGLHAVRNGKDIFGANATITIEHSFSEDKAKKGAKWYPTWGSCSSRTIEEKEIELAVIQRAFEMARRMNKNL